MQIHSLNRGSNETQEYKAELMHFNRWLKLTDRETVIIHSASGHKRLDHVLIDGKNKLG